MRAALVSEFVSTAAVYWFVFFCCVSLRCPLVQYMEHEFGHTQGGTIWARCRPSRHRSPQNGDCALRVSHPGLCTSTTAFRGTRTPRPRPPIVGTTGSWYCKSPPPPPLLLFIRIRAIGCERLEGLSLGYDSLSPARIVMVHMIRLVVEVIVALCCVRPPHLRRFVSAPPPCRTGPTRRVCMHDE